MHEGAKCDVQGYEEAKGEGHRCDLIQLLHLGRRSSGREK